MNYVVLTQQSLLGADIPMTGQVIPDNWKEVETPDMGRGIMIDISPLGYALLRWSRQHFSTWEDQFAALWRVYAQSFSFSDLRQTLNRHRVIIPRFVDREGLKRETDSLLRTPALQRVWLEWIVGQAALSRDGIRAVLSRWERMGNPRLEMFAPYAHHVLRCLLALVAAVNHRLLKWDPTHMIDLQYLYYLPFCMVLASDDRVHKTLAPALMRDDQSFVVAPILKKDLARVAAFWLGLDEAARMRMEFALGGYPPPAKDSIVWELWRKHMKEWTGPGNFAVKLAEDERDRAIAEARALFAAAGAV